MPSGVQRSPEQRVLEASMVLPDHGGVTGWAALRWHGATWFDGSTASQLERPVWLVTAGDDIRPQPGIAVSAERLDPREVVTVDGVRVTTPERSICFEARYAETLSSAVEAIDMAAYSDVVSMGEAHRYAAAHPGWTGIPRCRDALALADENSWSPAETRTRLVWVLVARLPGLLCNRPVFDVDGRHVGTPDLLDEESGTVVEYDGAAHLDLARRRRDVRREDRFRALGLEYLTVLASHLHDEAALAQRMVTARERSAFASVANRRWTLVPPRWWLPTRTVALRRRLSASDRERLLAHRRAA